MKCIIYLLLLLHVASCCSASVLIDLRPETGLTARANKLKKKEESESETESSSSLIFTRYIPAHIDSAELTGPELKQVADRSFQMVKAKCPGVLRDSLNGIYAFIQRLIPQSTNQLPPDLIALIQSINSCASVAVVNPNSRTFSNGQAYWSNFLAPYQSKLDSKQSDNAPMDMDASETTVTFPAQIGYYVPKIKTVLYMEDKNPSNKPKSPFQWFGNVFQSLNQYLDNTLTPSQGASRKKRQTEGVSGTSGTDILISKLVTNSMGSRDAFISFFDNLIRIHCAMCGQLARARNFKGVYKQLLLLIINDDSVDMQNTARTYLDNAFLRAMNQC